MLMQLNNTMIVPFRLYELLTQNRIIPDKFCPDNRFYVADSDGRIHSFMYEGTVKWQAEEETDAD